jgi:serine/threonine protein kinase/tetratricopeptide (TPR) repeat protein
MAAPTQLTGQTLGRYRVLEQIGAGGMGLVYRAHDEQLERDVAIKVLPSGTLANETVRKRFRMEALALAKLNHPNIATIFEFNTQNQTDYLATEYISGMGLDLKLAGAELPLKEVITLGMQLAQGLANAHEQGIVHRDLKPANLRLTSDGRLKILDFGLAQLMPKASSSGLTVTLTLSQEISGTLPYMAPEQLRGENADARTDIWAAGAVIYEMATGKRPFEEKVPTALAGDILYKTPVPPRRLRSALSRGMENVILKCLDKDPAKRYQSVRELARDLERLSTGRARFSRSHRAWQLAGSATLAVVFVLSAFWYLTHGPRTASASIRRSVAVLGFQNLSGRTDLAWISTALAEMLRTELAAGGKLRTVPGEKISEVKIGMSLPDTDSFGQETLSKIGKNLSSDDVVLGSYIPLMGDQIRLDLRLQDTADGATLLAVSEKGSASQLDDLVERAGSELREKLGVGDVAAGKVNAIRASFPRNPEAARFYSDGLNKARTFDNLAARDLFEKSIAVEPDFPLVHSALSMSWRALGHDQDSKDEARKALDLAAALPEEDRLAVEAQYHVAGKEWSKGAEIYRTLLRQYPDNVEYGLRLAEAQTWGGAPKDAVATLAALRKLPPPLGQDPRIDLAEAIAQGASGLGDFKISVQAAAAAAQKANAMGDRLLAAHATYWEGRGTSDLGDLQPALDKLLEAQHLAAQLGDRGGEALALSAIGFVYLSEDKLDLAMQTTQSALKMAREISQGENTADTLFTLALIYQAQGALEQSHRTFEEALVVYRQVGDQPGIIQTQATNASVLAHQLRLVEGRRDLEHGLAEHLQYGRKDAILQLGPDLVPVAIAVGDIPSAEKLAQQILSSAQEMGSSTVYGLGAVAQVNWTRDDLAGARSKFEEALRLASKEQSESNVAWWQAQIALVAADAGHLEEAEPLARKALSTVVQQNSPMDQLWALTTLADILLREKKYKEAIPLGARCDAIASKSEDKWAVSGYVPIAIRIRAAESKPAIEYGETLLAEYAKAGCMECQLNTRLALGEVEMNFGKATAGRVRLGSLEKDARDQGFLLIARQAADLQRLR